MAVLPAKTEFESWSAAGSGLRIEYPAALLEQICTEAVEALEAAYGGIGIGGVLFGTHAGGTVRVTASRPLPSEHAYGHRFILSERDYENLRLLLSAPRRDPDLRGLVPVGWYHSIPRGGLALTARDAEVQDRFFPQPWQLAVAIHPEREEPSTVAFCVRDGDPRALFKTRVQGRRQSAVRPEPGPEPVPRPAAEPKQAAPPAPASATTFGDLPEPAIWEKTAEPEQTTAVPEAPKAEPALEALAQPAAHALPAGPSPPETARALDERKAPLIFEPPPPPAPLLPISRTQRQLFPTPAAEQGAPAQLEAPKPPLAEGVETVAPVPAGAGSGAALPAWAQSEALPKRRRWWLWAIPAVLLVAAAAAGAAWYLNGGGAKPELALWVTDLGGQLMIEWDRAAAPVQRAVGGTLEIVDGGERVVMKMDAEKLREGSVDYVRRSEVVDVKLTVLLGHGRTATDTIRFVGPPVARVPADDVIRERDALKQQVDRLKAELNSER